LEAIRTTAKDAATGAVFCAAELNINVPQWGILKESMTYKVEKTADGQLFITVDYLK
jgi:hypothetical protein